MDSPEGETPQTEITVQQKQDSENGFPQGGDPVDRQLFNKVRILKVDSPEGETPHTERARHSQDSENGCPQGGRPRRQMSLYLCYI